MCCARGLSCGMKKFDYSSSPERLFKDRGPFFHVCSKPVDKLLFNNDQDRTAALVNIAMAAEESSVVLLAYAIMSNHFHVILAGNAPEQFYACFKERANRYLSRHGEGGRSLPEEPTIVPITTIYQMMNEVVYVVRNQYVVDASVNPLSHIWCSGFLYFNPMMKQLALNVKYVPAATLSGRGMAKLTFSKETEPPFGDLTLLNGFPAPSSFVDYKLVECLFSDARQFTTKLFKNVEGQIETARLLGEVPVIPDEELSGLMWKYCKDEWGVDKIRQLSTAQKIALAKHMKVSYHSSNSQISRITLLERNNVDALFPLSAK